MWLNKWSLPLVLLLATTTLSTGFVRAADSDSVEGEDEEVLVEEADIRTGDITSEGEGAGDGDPDALKTVKAHPDADTYLLITKPNYILGNQLPAGKDVSLLVGFTNRGKNTFLVESMEASFRYAMDFSFHLQNFSAIAYNRQVKPEEQATFAYSFFVSDAYSTRPYGFTVNLNYRDAEGNQYLSAVFNETVSIIELDEGLDGETFFLYILLTSILALGVFSIYHYFFAGRKRTGYSLDTKTVEVGTANQKDVDYDWLPKGTLEALNKSPSSRQRKVRTE